jgi:hypothetical protein
MRYFFHIVDKYGQACNVGSTIARGFCNLLLPAMIGVPGFWQRRAARGESQQRPPIKV